MGSTGHETWADKLTIPAAVLLSVVLYSVATVLANAAPAFSVGETFLPLSVGTTVGIALAANRREIRFAAMLGGSLASFVHFVFVTETSLLRWGGYIAEISIALVLGLAVVIIGYPRGSVRQSGPDNYRPTLVGFLAACASAVASYAFVFNSTDAGIGFWVLSHGTATFAAGGALLSGRGRWLSSANPTENLREVLLALSLVTASVAATFTFQLSWVWAGSGICMLLAVRFGTKLALPVALAFVVVVTIGIAQQWGPSLSRTIDDFDVLGISAALVIINIVGQLANSMDHSAKSQRDSAGQWRKLAERVGFDAFIEADDSHRIVLASESINEIFGTEARELRGSRLRDVFSEGDWDHIEALIDRVVAGQTVRYERQFTAANGKPIWTLCIIEPRLNKSNEYDGFTMFILDISNTRRTIEDGVESRATYADVQEEERQRLAQLVHDGALQDLAAANLLIGAARLSADGHDGSASVMTSGLATISAQLDRVEALLVSGMRQLRVDAIGSPTIDLTDIDVIESLRQTIAKFQSMNAANVHLGECDLSTAGPRLSRTLYSIAQEAVVNAILHSQASSISVDLQRTSDGFSVTVVDDGVGFDPELLQEVGHLGLSAMTNLAHEAGGWISLSTRPGLGTTIEAWVPAVPRRSPRATSLQARRTAASQMPVGRQDPLESPSPPLQADSTKTSL